MLFGAYRDLVHNTVFNINIRSYLNFCAERLAGAYIHCLIQQRRFCQKVKTAPAAHRREMTSAGAHRCRAPFLPCGRKNNSLRNTARWRPLSQGVPSSKTVHWTVFEFTPCGGIAHAWGFALCGARPGRCPWTLQAFKKAWPKLSVLFPAAFIQNAGYKASSRVQSERSERLRELTPAALSYSVLTPKKYCLIIIPENNWIPDKYMIKW